MLYTKEKSELVGNYAMENGQKDAYDVGWGDKK